MVLSKDSGTNVLTGATAAAGARTAMSTSTDTSNAIQVAVFVTCTMNVNTLSTATCRLECYSSKDNVTFTTEPFATKDLVRVVTGQTIQQFSIPCSARYVAFKLYNLDATTGHDTTGVEIDVVLQTLA